MLDSLPEGLNFGGDKLTFLYWNDAPFADFEAETSGDKILNAIYTRNVEVSDRLGITLEWVGIPGNTKNRESFATTVQGSTNSNSGDFDIVSAHSLVGQDLFVRNLLTNLNEVYYLDFSKPWWPGQLTEAATVGKKLGFASGDISTNMLWYMTVMFYNVSLAQTYGIEDLHDVVLSGKWTLEKMENVIKNTYLDVNTSGVKDVGDRFGFYCPSTTIDSFLFGSGISVIDAQAVRSFLYGTQEGVYESLGKTTLIFFVRLCVYRYNTRIVNNLLYHKCPIFSRDLGSLVEFLPMVFFFLWGIDDFFSLSCSSIITIDEFFKGKKYIYYSVRVC